MIRVKKEFAPLSIHFETENDLLKFKSVLINFKKNEMNLNGRWLNRGSETSEQSYICTKLLNELEF